MNSPIPTILIARKGLIFTLLILILLLSPVGAEKTAPPDRGEFLTLKIAVFGPGDPLYVWWGHIGLIVEDELSGRSLFYDYGLFSFENDNFYQNFAEGRMLYSCGASPAQRAIERYRMQNRDITLYTLNLSPEKREEVWRFAENNILPENRDYYYHMFDDNCSTRIRDIIDLSVDGQFRTYGEEEGRLTLRQHVRRHSWFNPAVDWFLSFILGPATDKPITIWDEMFLPGEVGRQLLDFNYTDETGETRKLVSQIESVYRAPDRPVVLETPKNRWPASLLAGLILAAVIIFLKLRPSQGSRISLGILQTFLGLFLGIAGGVICYMAFFTNHDYSWNSLNPLFINPLFLAALPLGIIAAAGRGKQKSDGRTTAERLLSGLWTLTFTLAILTIILNILPQIRHDNRITLAAFLPPAFVLSGYFNRIVRYISEKRK